MSNIKILEKLVKITSAQQKVLTKLAQAMDNNDIAIQAGDFIRKSTVIWMTNNEVNAKFSYSFNPSEVPGYDFELKVTFSPPAPDKPIRSPFMSLSAKYKEYIVGVISNYPPLQSKSVKVDVQESPRL